MEDQIEKLARRYVEARNSRGAASDFTKAYLEGMRNPDPAAAKSKFRGYKAKLVSYLDSLEAGSAPGDYLQWTAALLVDMAYEAGRMQESY